MVVERNSIWPAPLQRLPLISQLGLLFRGKKPRRRFNKSLWPCIVTFNRKVGFIFNVEGGAFYGPILANAATQITVNGRLAA